MQLCGVIAQDALLHGVCFVEVVREGVVGNAWWREGDINNPNFSELSYLTGRPSWTYRSGTELCGFL